MHRLISSEYKHVLKLKFYLIPGNANGEFFFREMVLSLNLEYN